MNLHEYQAKELFAEYGLPVADGRAVQSAEEAVAAARALGGEAWAVKAQVHAGGRGKAGGVSLARSLDEVRAVAGKLLGKRLVTKQTDALGQPIDKVFVEAAVDIADEFYLGAVVDRSSQRIVFMASTEGGVDIETVAAETPERIYRVSIDPFAGASAWQGRQLAFLLGFGFEQVKAFVPLFLNLARLFQAQDCGLLEVNPLVVTKSGEFSCLDAKINIDDNALFRQQKVVAMRDPAQEDEREREAAKFGLNYVALDGTIGCMVNGAGLAMATMDLVKLEGGSPANFLDVGGGVTKDAVTEALKIILSDKKVKAVFINIFGGIVSCATIAEGIVAAVKEVGVFVPVIVRFEGNNAVLGRQILQQSGLNITAADGLLDAARKAVTMAQATS